jgi:hypothetical protein
MTSSTPALPTPIPLHPAVNRPRGSSREKNVTFDEERIA